MYRGNYVRHTRPGGEPWETVAGKGSNPSSGGGGSSASPGSSGWDGAWFLRAYNAFGAPVGSRECEEGQIYIEPQGMCVMAGIALGRREQQPPDR